MKKITIAVVLAVLLLLAMPVAVSAAAGVTVVDRTGDGEWIDDTWQVEIYPGETKATTLTLYNSSSSSLGVEVKVIPDSLDNGNLTFELDNSSFTMPGRSYADITLTVKASDSTTPGTYTAELEIKSEVAPTPPPSDGVSMFRLYDLTVENITEGSADILWKTGRSTTTELTYWSSSEITVKDESYLKEHIIHLEELKEGTAYSFEVTCKDRYGLKRSDEGEFITLEKEIIPEPEEPEEPIVEEPEEPTVEEPIEEPEEPEVEEPIVEEPEEEEPEVIEPGEEEEEEVIVPAKPRTPWGLIGGVVGGLAAAGGIGYWLWLWRRRRERR